MKGLSRRQAIKAGCAGVAVAMIPRAGRAAPALPAMQTDSPWRSLFAYDPTRTYNEVNLSALAYPHFSNWYNSLDVAIHAAGSTTPIIKIFYNPNCWSKLNSKTWRHQENSAAVEKEIRAGCNGNFLGYQMNMYSTTNPDGNSYAEPVLRFKKRTDPFWSLSARVAKTARPAQNSDGYMAVLQPDGWVLETMATIKMANGDVVCMFAGFSNPRGRCDGSAGGRRASLVPNYAGVLRSGELSSGEIKHALAVGLGPEALAKAIRYPAYTMDRNPFNYAGTVPMGALLAIPPGVNLSGVSFKTSQGRTIAKAAQKYGMYVVDRSGPKGLNIIAETGATDVPGYSWSLMSDLLIVRNMLRLTTKPTPA